MDDNCGEWVESMDVVSRRWVWLVCLAQVRVFTLHFADSHFSGPGSSGHCFLNRARRFGPGSGLIKSAF